MMRPPSTCPQHNEDDARISHDGDGSTILNAAGPVRMNRPPACPCAVAWCQQIYGGGFGNATIPQLERWEKLDCFPPVPTPPRRTGLARAFRDGRLTPTRSQPLPPGGRPKERAASPRPFSVSLEAW